MDISVPEVEYDGIELDEEEEMITFMFKIKQEEGDTIKIKIPTKPPSQLTIEHLKSCPSCMMQVRTGVAAHMQHTIQMRVDGGTDEPPPPQPVIIHGTKQDLMEQLEDILGD
jgi:hypothetical protein